MCVYGVGVLAVCGGAQGDRARGPPLCQGGLLCAPSPEPGSEEGAPSLGKTVCQPPSPLAPLPPESPRLAARRLVTPSSSQQRPPPRSSWLTPVHPRLSASFLTELIGRYSAGGRRAMARSQLHGDSDMGACSSR